MTLVTISVDISTEGDNGQFGHEEHQLILSEDEQFIGIAMLWVTDPAEVDELTYS